MYSSGFHNNALAIHHSKRFGMDPYDYSIVRGLVENESIQRK